MDTEESRTSASSFALLRGRFGIFWAGRSLSQLGSAIGSAAVPLVAVIALRATPQQMGLLAAARLGCSTVSRLLGSIPADRTRNRFGVLIALDVVQACLAGVIPVLFLFRALTIGILIGIISLAGIASGVQGAYATPLTVMLTEREQIVRANGLLDTSSSAAGVAGPAITALLVKFLAAPFAMVADGISDVGSAVTYSMVGRKQKEPSHLPPLPTSEEREPPKAVTARVRQCLSAFWNAFALPDIRGLLGLMAGVTILNGVVAAQFSLFMIRDLGLSASVASLVGAGGSIGGIVGGLSAGALVDRLGLSRAGRAALLVLGLSVIGLPFAPHGPLGIVPCLGYELLAALGGTVTIVVVFGAIQQRLPTETLARGIAAAALVPELGQLVGALAGGAIASQTGIRKMLLGVVAVELVMFILVSVFLRRLSQRNA